MDPHTQMAVVISQNDYLYTTGSWSDLIIKSRTREYRVHRSVLAAGPHLFFTAALKDHRFSESQNGVINLENEDPDMVEHMIRYSYYFDYLPESPTCPTCGLSKSSEPRASEQRHSADRAPTAWNGKLDFSVIEDPLVAMLSSSASSSSASSPTRSTPTRSTVVATAKPATTPRAYEDVENPFNNALYTDTDQHHVHHLVTHAKMFGIAEKYNNPGLKYLARKKFVDQIDYDLEAEYLLDFADACLAVYSLTVHTEQGLRNVIMQVFRERSDLRLHEHESVLDVKKLASQFAIDLDKVVAHLPTC